MTARQERCSYCVPAHPLSHAMRGCRSPRSTRAWCSSRRPTCCSTSARGRPHHAQGRSRWCSRRKGRPRLRLPRVMALAKPAKSHSASSALVGVAFMAQLRRRACAPSVSPRRRVCQCPELRNHAHPQPVLGTSHAAHVRRVMHANAYEGYGACNSELHRGMQAMQLMQMIQQMRAMGSAGQVSAAQMQAARQQQARAAAAQRAPMSLRRDVAPKTGKKVGWLCRFGWFATDPLLLEPGETQCTVSMRLWAQVQEMPRQAPIACTPQCVT